MSVADVFRSGSSGITLAGKVESGSLILNEKLTLVPLGEAVTVRSISVHGEEAKIARAGDNVEVSVTGVSDPALLNSGQMLCPIDSPVRMVTSFEVQLLTLDIKIPLIQGTQVEVHAQTQDVAGHISLLKSTGKKDPFEKKAPRQVTKNSVAIVVVTVETALPLELYSDLRALGRVLLRRQGATIAVGVVTQLLS